MKCTNVGQGPKRAYNAVLINRDFTDLNPLFVGYEICRAGKSFGPFVRSYTLIHYVVQGEGYIYKNGNRYHAQAGEAFLIHPDELVTYQADEINPWHYQWVSFTGQLTERLRELPCVVRFPHGLLQEMLDAVEKDMPEYRITALLFQMYADLFEGKKARHHYVRQVQDHIRALYMQPMRVEAIAEQMNLDRRYLSRLFKEKTGQTIQEYLISVRMEAAQKRLEEGFSVDETARLCGYEDSTNFSKMFKKQFGISPLYWQRAKNE